MKILLISFLVISAFLGTGYLAYNSLQNKLLEATETIATLEQSLDESEEAIQYLQTAQEDMQATVTYLNTSFSEIRANNQRLEERLAAHDLNRLAYERPELVTRIINNASEEALRCLEILSGSPLTANEREATNAEQFNSECPWLFTADRLQ